MTSACSTSPTRRRPSRSPSGRSRTSADRRGLRLRSGRQLRSQRQPSADGKLAFVSYWDSGFVALDLTDPANPVFKGRTVYEADEDGDAHSSQYDEARKLLFTGDEDFCKMSGSGTEKGYGYLRVYDYSTLSAPKQIGEYRTPNTPGGDDQGAGDYTIHNNFLVGTTLYTSWYSDGIRVIDCRTRAPRRRSPSSCRRRASTPSSRRSAERSRTRHRWGVVDEATGLVYASDMNSGLWILRRTG